jgi:hypothetical protein
MAESDRPIFVLGCPRSGTTLFRTMLHAHPRIAIPPESRFLMAAYYRRSAFGDLTTEAGRARLAEWIVDNPGSRFRVFGLDGDAVKQKIVAGPPTVGSAVGVVFQEYSRRFGKPRWGDKRPAYYSFIDELDHMFPDAQFLHLVRDGRACVASLKKQPWYDHDPVPCIATWMLAIDSARDSARKLGADRYLEVRYEDLVDDPEAELRQVCEFLDEDYDPAMREPEKIADRVNPSYYEQRRQIGEGLYTKSVEAWREKLEPWEIATIERVAGERMTEFGYELSGLGGEPPADKVRAVLEAHAGWVQSARQRRRAAARRIVNDDQRVTAMLTTGQREAAARPIQRPLSARLRRFVRPVARPVRAAFRDAVSAVRRPGEPATAPVDEEQT